MPPGLPSVAAEVPLSIRNSGPESCIERVQARSVSLDRTRLREFLPPVFQLIEEIVRAVVNNWLRGARLELRGVRADDDGLTAGGGIGH